MANPDPSNLAQFLGRLHPLLVHLPIGFLVLLAFAEFVAILPRLRHFRQTRPLILVVSAISAICAVVCGWMLARNSEYDTTLLAWHKWTGVALAAATVLTSLAYWLLHRGFYYVGFTGTLLLLLLVGHLGGSMTHGQDYLTEYAPPFIRTVLDRMPRRPAPAPVPSPAPVAEAPRVETEQKPANPLQAVVFTDLVQPILNQKCIACHGAEKSRGQLRLDSLDALMHGGKSGPAIAAGRPEASLLVQRMLLPSTDSKHMPPDGKPQPSDAELALIQWWIESGAPAGKAVTELSPPGRIISHLEAMFGTAPQSVGPKPLSELQPAIEQLSTQTGVVLTPLEAGRPWLSCNASVARSFGDEQLTSLLPLAANIKWLNLAGTRITDAALTTIAQMPNLERLHLQQTAITDAGLQPLTKLRHLAYLNLYGTPITDAGLNHLKTIGSLRQVYLWDTKVSDQGAKALASSLVDSNSIRRWQLQIEQLQAQIRQQAVLVDHGAPLLAAVASQRKPINTQCPISGGAIKADKTVEYEGRLIGFCCDDCIAKFRQDPKPVLAKLP